MDYTELQLLFIGKNFGNHSVKFEIFLKNSSYIKLSCHHTGLWFTCFKMVS